MSEKKVAICFYGHLRSWDQTKNSFVTNILESMYPVIPDIFIHTFDKVNNDSLTSLSTQDIQNKLNSSFKLPTYNVTIQPKKIVVDNTEEFHSQIQQEAMSNNLYAFGYGDIHGVDKTLKEIKKISLSYNLMKDFDTKYNKNYDFIMMTRFDFEFTQPICDLTSLTNDNTIYTWYTGNPDPCDEIVIGNRRCMDIFVSRYTEIFTLTNVSSVLPEMGWCPTNDSHLLLKHCYIKYGIGNWGWTNFNAAQRVLC